MLGQESVGRDCGEDKKQRLERQRRLPIEPGRTCASWAVRTWESRAQTRGQEQCGRQEVPGGESREREKGVGGGKPEQHAAKMP